MGIRFDNQFCMVPRAAKVARVGVSFVWTIGCVASLSVFAQHWGLFIIGLPAFVITYVLLAIHAGTFAKFVGHLKTGFPAEPLESERFRESFNPYARGWLFPISVLRGFVGAFDNPGAVTGAVLDWFSHRHGFPERLGDFHSPVGDANSRAAQTIASSIGIGIVWTTTALAVVDPLGILIVLVVSVSLPTVTGALVAASYFDDLDEIPVDAEARACSLINSPVAAESNCIYEGDNLTNGSTLLVPVPAHQENEFTCGNPGGGKSAGEERKAAQLIMRPQCSMIVADMKGDDMAIAMAPLEAAKRAGIKLDVKFFTTTVGWPSHTFNLFEQDWFEKQTPDQKALQVGRVFGTTHDLTVHGQDWYGGAGLKLYEMAFERYKFRNLVELETKLGQMVTNPRQYGVSRVIARDGMKAWLDVGRLAKIKPLNVIGNPKGIQLSELHEKKQLLILRLPSIELFQLSGILYRFFSTFGIEAGRHAVRNNWIFSVGDESIAAMGGSLDMCLQQGRSQGLSFSLTAHSWGTLGPQNEEVVRSTTRIHREYSVADKQRQKMIAETSGKVIIWLQSRKKHWMLQSSTTYGSGTVTRKSTPVAVTDVTETETIVDRWFIDDVSRASADPRCSLFTLVKDGDGLWLGGQTQIVMCDFFISKEEHERRRKAPWIDHNPDEGTVICGAPDVDAGGAPAEQLPPEPQGSPVTRQTIEPHQPRPRRKSRRYNPLHQSIKPPTQA